MALLNEIQVGRLNSKLHKLLDMKEGAPAPQLAGDVQPGLILENDRPEWLFLGGERPCWGGGTQAAVAGEVSHIQLLNPASSGTLAVVERIWASPGSASLILVGHLDAALAGASQLAGGFRDGRLERSSLQSTCIVNSDTSVGSQLTAVMMRTPSNSNVPWSIDGPIILSPGTGVCVQLASANILLYVSFMWRERSIEPSELR